MAAQADLGIAEQFEAGARPRAQEESEAEAARAKEAAIASLMVNYDATSGDLSGAITEALRAVVAVFAAATRHSETAHAGLIAAGLRTSDAVPGYGRLVTPSPLEVVEAVRILAEQELGLVASVSYPAAAIEPIVPFLKTRVAV